MLRKNLYKRHIVNTAKKKKKLKSKFKYSLCTTTYGTIFFKELEATRRVIARQLGRLYKSESFVNINYPITKKGLQSRMGKGKGSFSHFIGFVRKGYILLEVLSYIDSKLVFKSLMMAKKKLSIHTIVIYNSKYIC